MVIVNRMLVDYFVSHSYISFIQKRHVCNLYKVYDLICLLIGSYFALCVVASFLLLVALSHDFFFFVVLGVIKLTLKYESYQYCVLLLLSCVNNFYQPKINMLSLILNLN